LTLFPGQDNDSERQTTRPVSRKRQPQPKQSTGAAPGNGRDCNPDETGQKTPRPAEQKEPTRAADGIVPASPAPAARSRLAGFADAFGKLAEDLAASDRRTRAELAPNGADTGIAPESTADDGQLHHDREPVQPDPSDDAAPTAGISPTDWPTERPAAALRNFDETGFEPSPERAAEICESIEPDPSEVERERVEHQIDSDRVSSNDVERESVEFVVHSDGSERKIRADVGADERTAEQSGDPDEEIAQTDPLEAIALQWTDAELLANEQKVKAYFKTILPEPDGSEGKRLKEEVNRSSTEWLQASRETRDCKQKVDELGEARSFLVPFGSPHQEVEAAKSRYEGSLSDLYQAERGLNQAQTRFKEWQGTARRYRDWRHGPEGERMHELKAIVELKPVQERLTQIHAEQKRRQGLEVLEEWRKVAISLDRPDDYVLRIREVTAAFRRGGVLSEQAIGAMSQDFEVYQQQQEIQQRQQHRHRGFSL
jgi:hypothetical protein